MSETYEIFARSEEDQALTRLGRVTVEQDASVEDAVKKLHGEDWVELVAIPAGAVGWAIGEEPAR